MKALLILVTISLSLPAMAAPQHVRLSWCGAPSESSMCITWNDNSAGAGTVEYTFPGEAAQTVSAVSIQAPAPLNHIYEAEILGLKKNSHYTYRVQSSGTWSSEYWFDTAPTDPCAPFTFAVLGDNRSQDSTGTDPKWNSILGEAIENGASFVINTGDLVKDGDQVAQWKNYLETTDPLHSHFLLFPSIGNHDDDKVQGEGALYNMLFQLPRNDSTNTEDFYFFTYGDAIFVSLTTQNFTDNGFQQQAQWLDKVLTDHPKRWKFVFFHHPIYTSTDPFGWVHPPNEKGQNAAFVPMFDKHHVDIVFSGHNHFYERFNPQKGGGGSSEGKSAQGFDEGTVYITTGGAGALTFDLAGDLFKLFCPSAQGSAICDGRHHYVRVNINKNTLTLTTLSSSAQNFGSDPNNVEELDKITITKTQAIECEVEGTGSDTGSDTSGTGTDTGSDTSGTGADTGSVTTGGQTDSGSVTTGTGADTGSVTTGGQTDSGSVTTGTGADTGSMTTGGETDSGSDSTGGQTDTGNTATSGGTGMDDSSGGGTTGNTGPVDPTRGETDSSSSSGDTSSGCTAGFEGTSSPLALFFVFLSLLWMVRGVRNEPRS